MVFLVKFAMTTTTTTTIQGFFNSTNGENTEGQAKSVWVEVAGAGGRSWCLVAWETGLATTEVTMCPGKPRLRSKQDRQRRRPASSYGHYLGRFGWFSLVLLHDHLLAS